MPSSFRNIQEEQDIDIFIPVSLLVKLHRPRSDFSFFPVSWICRRDMNLALVHQEVFWNERSTANCQEFQKLLEPMLLKNFNTALTDFFRYLGHHCRFD